VIAACSCTICYRVCNCLTNFPNRWGRFDICLSFGMWFRCRVWISYRNEWHFEIATCFCSFQLPDSCRCNDFKPPFQNTYGFKTFLTYWRWKNGRCFFEQLSNDIHIFRPTRTKQCKNALKVVMPFSALPTQIPSAWLTSAKWTGEMHRQWGHRARFSPRLVEKEKDQLYGKTWTSLISLMMRLWNQLWWLIHAVLFESEYLCMLRSTSDTDSIWPLPIAIVHSKLVR